MSIINEVHHFFRDRYATLELKSSEDEYLQMEFEVRGLDFRVSVIIDMEKFEDDDRFMCHMVIFALEHEVTELAEIAKLEDIEEFLKSNYDYAKQLYSHKQSENWLSKLSRRFKSFRG